MTDMAQLDCLQDHLGDSLSTPPGTENIAHSMPASASILLTEPGADPVPEPDRASRFAMVGVFALVVVTTVLGLFAWLG